MVGEVKQCAGELDLNRASHGELRRGKPGGPEKRVTKPKHMLPHLKLNHNQPLKQPFTFMRYTQL